MADISSEQIKALLSNPETLERIASMVESFGGSGLSQLLAGSAPESSAPESSAPESDVLPQKEPENAALSESSVPPTKPHAPEAQEAAAMLPAASGISPSAPLGALLSGKGTPDRRITLLKAIRPYVNDAKKERVDGLVRALSVAGLLNNYKNTLLG